MTNSRKGEDSAKPRLLRTPEEAFAAGCEHGAKFKPLTEQQINTLAAIFAPTLNAPRNTKQDEP